MNKSELIDHVAQAAGLSKADADARVMKVAKIMHLTEVLDRMPNQISEGEKQRLAVARAIVRDPLFVKSGRGIVATAHAQALHQRLLRGLQGERVRVLTDGIGSIDVSNTSVDHAAVVNPLLAERIEVLRGPQSLLYGSSAIGGVVNVIDRRIPVKVPDEPVHLGAIATYGSAASERSLAAASDVGLGGGWVLHGDGSWSKSNDLKIGGFALTPDLRAKALATSLLPPDPNSDVDFAANAAQRDTLPNTAARSQLSFDFDAPS